LLGIPIAPVRDALKMLEMPPLAFRSLGEHMQIISACKDMMPMQRHLDMY